MNFMYLPRGSLLNVVKFINELGISCSTIPEEVPFNEYEFGPFVSLAKKHSMIIDHNNTICY